MKKEIVVTELFPVSVAPLDQEILAYIGQDELGNKDINNTKFYVARWDKYYQCFCTESNRIDTENIIGWIHMPIYKPSRKFKEKS